MNSLDSPPTRAELSRATLLPLTYIPHTQTYNPHNRTEYYANASFRRALLKARTVLAAGFINGDLASRRPNFAVKSLALEWLIIGHSEALAGSTTDLLQMIGASSAKLDVLDPQVKALLPISSLDSGWKKQFGWLAIKNPNKEVDMPALYTFLRWSVLWLETHPSSVEALQQARGIASGSIRELDYLFEETPQTDAVK